MEGWRATEGGWDTTMRARRMDKAERIHGGTTSLQICTACQWQGSVIETECTANCA